MRPSMIGLLAFRLDGRWTAMSSRTTRWPTAVVRWRAYCDRLLKTCGAPLPRRANIHAMAQQVSTLVAPRSLTNWRQAARPVLVSHFGSPAFAQRVECRLRVSGLKLVALGSRIGECQCPVYRLREIPFAAFPPSDVEGRSGKRGTQRI